MQTINLQKNQTISLKKEISTNLNKIIVGLGWAGKRGADIDLDSYVELKTDTKSRLVYFGRLNDEKGVKHFGDDLVGGGKKGDPNEEIEIILNEIDSDVKIMNVGVAIYSGAPNLSKVIDAFMVIKDENKELVRYNIAKSFDKDKNVVTGQFIRNDKGDWDFKALGISNGKSMRVVIADVKRNNRIDIASNDQIVESEAPKKGFFQRLFS